MSDKTIDRQLILASGSKRRSEILSLLDIPFSTCTPDVDETFIGTDAEKNCMRIAKLKANLVAGCTPNSIVISADTIISTDGKIMGKAESRNDAREMLLSFSGNVHRVYTGFCVSDTSSGFNHSGYDVTEVLFEEMNTRDIEWYLDTQEWLGVAGAYRIQEAGACFIKSITGSYYTVMGLPIHRIYGILRQINFI